MFSLLSLFAAPSPPPRRRTADWRTRSRGNDISAAPRGPARRPLRRCRPTSVMTFPRANTLIPARYGLADLEALEHSTTAP